MGLAFALQPQRLAAATLMEVRVVLVLDDRFVPVLRGVEGMALLGHHGVVPGADIDASCGHELCAGTLHFK